MNVQKKEATALTMAERNKTYKESYPKAVPLSSLKTYIGDLLFSLDGTNRPDGWQVFETNLRRFYEVKL